VRGAFAGLCASFSVLAFPGRTAKRRLEALFPRPQRAAQWQRMRNAGSREALLPALVIGALAATLLHSAVLALVLPYAWWQARQTWVRRAARLAEDRRRAEAVALCLALRSELQGGRQAHTALADAARSTCPELADRLAAAAATGEDLFPILRAEARTPGREAFAYLAACWHVSEGGAGMADAVGHLATALRATEAQRREVCAELAGVRSSSRILAALPAVGVILGTGMGAGPLDVLLHAAAGQVCLVLGLALVAGGMAWMNRIVRAATVTL
jgi:tight adherence protein B